jgi:hypothetical protein
MKFRGPQALDNRRQKAIVYPTKTIHAFTDRRSAQRNEELVVQAFLPLWILNERVLLRRRHWLTPAAYLPHCVYSPALAFEVGSHQYFA